MGPNLTPLLLASHFPEIILASINAPERARMKIITLCSLRCSARYRPGKRTTWVPEPLRQSLAESADQASQVF